MEVGLTDIFGLFIIFSGLKVIIDGKVDVEVGITNGAKRNSKFIKSSKSRLEGNSARIFGICICLLGALLILFFPDENVLFTIPYP